VDHWHRACPKLTPRTFANNGGAESGAIDWSTPPAKTQPQNRTEFTECEHTPLLLIQILTLTLLSSTKQYRMILGSHVFEDFTAVYFTKLS